MKEGWNVPGETGNLRNCLFGEPYALSRTAGYTKVPYTLGSSWGSNGRIVAMGFEGSVFVITVREGR